MGRIVSSIVWKSCMKIIHLLSSWPFPLVSLNPWAGWVPSAGNFYQVIVNTQCALDRWMHGWVMHRHADDSEYIFSSVQKQMGYT